MSSKPPPIKLKEAIGMQRCSSSSTDGARRCVTSTKRRGGMKVNEKAAGALRSALTGAEEIGVTPQENEKKEVA